MQEGTGPRPFDVTTRRLIEEDPASWLQLAGLPVNGPVHPVESEVSTVLAEVDKLLRVNADEPWLAHLEVQASRDPRLPSRLLQYHALLRHRHALPIESTVILLRPEADGAEMAGRLDLQGATGDLTLSFWFRVVRLWELPVETLLSSGLGILPLAPLAAITPDRLPDVIRRIESRLDAAGEPRTTVDEIWASTMLLLGLRYDEGAVRSLFRRFPQMRESITYQMILAEGRDEGRLAEARRNLLDIGAEKFGTPAMSVVTRIEQIDELDVLHQLMRQVFHVSSWQELLALTVEN